MKPAGTTISSAYTTRRQSHLALWQQLTQRYNYISAVRLALVLGIIFCVYRYFNTADSLFLWAAALAAGLFILLLNLHTRISWKRRIEKALIQINEQELAYLSHESIPFADGLAHSDPVHAYTYDLDIFGKNSLFQHLNRTATWIGETHLAGLLGSLLPNERIRENQEAIQSLAPKIGWRQHTLAIATLISDSKDAYDKLMRWARTEVREMPVIIIAAMYAMPALLMAAIAAFAITRAGVWADAITWLFLLNLLILGSQAKRIRQEMRELDKVAEITRLYGLILEQIEKEPFEAPRLLALKAQLEHENTYASQQIKKLATLFSNMEGIQNGLAAILFNGFLLYHLHTLRALIGWRKKYAAQMPAWLAVIGEIEALNSLANFSCNNPAFAFPTLNDRAEIAFQDLGHPLIREAVRVCNSVDFNAQRFIILTGSNMSGKSTFLRTLGINMVLAGIGAPFCATRADLHPLNVLVSMRLSDSLSDSESYFFAEVKRLKSIMNQLDAQVCFVLLDEILRGTNSDDKRSGTIEVIKKMVQKKAIGAIATHDLEVCLTAAEHPEALTNQCFEVEIIDNELVFDYRLRDGVCKNKSATFLMKKMGII